MTNTLHERWGASLRQAREDMRLSQEALAQLMGVTQSAISRAEAGQIVLSDEHRIAAAAVLGVEVEDIWAYPSTTKVAS